MSWYPSSDWDGMRDRTGKPGVDRLLAQLEREVLELQVEIEGRKRRAATLWDKHAPYYAEDGTRVRGGNSGGWE